MKAGSTLILMAALLIASIAAGCGGDDSSDASETTITTSALSKPAFVNEVNSICERAEAQIFKSTERAGQSQKEEEEEVIQRLGLALESIVEGIQGVGAPAGDVAEVEAIAAAFQQAADEIEELDPVSFTEAEKLLRAPANLADEYGLKLCVFR